MTDTTAKKAIFHIPVLDGLRALAALSVCLYHFVCTVIGFISSETVLNVFNYGKYGVQLFFVISGLVIPWSLYHSNYKLASYPKFLLKRFIRLEPPYVVMILVAIVYTYVRTMSPYYNGVDITPNVKQVLLHFGYLIPFFEGEKWLNPVFWTLAVEFQYYISIALLFLLINHQNKWFRWLSYSILLGISFIGSREFFPYWAPVFMFGILLFLYKVKKIGLAEFITMIVVSSLFTAININITTLIVSLLAVFTILFAFHYSNRLFRWLGDLTYSVYLVHTIIGAAFVNYCSHIVHHPLAKIAVVIGGVLISIGSAWLLFRFVEKPSKKLSSGLKL